MLAVAQRTPDGNHSVLLARAKNGQLPLELAPLDILGSADVELSAPALAALPDGGFALMWSQGSGWQRLVRVQRLSSTPRAARGALGCFNARSRAGRRHGGRSAMGRGSPGRVLLRAARGGVFLVGWQPELRRLSSAAHHPQVFVSGVRVSALKGVAAAAPRCPEARARRCEL